MLFLLKRCWQTALTGLVVLTALGLVLRGLVPEPTPLGLSVANALLGVAVFAAVLGSDALLHGLFLLLFGDSYRLRYYQLAGLFHRQGLAAMLLGALMACVGEELVFRGLGMGPVYLLAAAALFGLLHHVLWPFTFWAIYQGVLFASAIYLTQALTVTVVAHFLHDLTGFLLFAHLNRRGFATSR